MPITYANLLIDTDMDDKSMKQADMMLISRFISRRRDNVPVNDIMQMSGAERLRVYPILFEMEQNGLINVVKRSVLGAPLMLRGAQHSDSQFN